LCDFGGESKPPPYGVDFALIAQNHKKSGTVKTVPLF